MFTIKWFNDSEWSEIKKKRAKHRALLLIFSLLLKYTYTLYIHSYLSIFNIRTNTYMTCMNVCGQWTYTLFVFVQSNNALIQYSYYLV